MKRGPNFLPILIRCEANEHEGQIPGQIPIGEISDTEPIYVRRLSDAKTDSKLLTDEERSQWKAFKMVDHAIRHGDPGKLATALQTWGLAYGKHFLWDSAETDNDDWMFEFTKLLNSLLGSPRLVFWWSIAEQRALHGIYCEKLFQAWICMWSMSKKIGVCPACSNLALMSRPAQKYCSKNCQARAGMKRLRARKKRIQKRGTRGAGLRER